MRKHWAEELADNVISKYEEPYTITGGITTSGPTHLGTVCEFLFPGTVRNVLEKNGKKAVFYFIADILDAFDSIPVAMQKYSDELAPHLGEPLCNVPDPTGKSKSFGDHFLDEAVEIMGEMGVKAEVKRMNELYADGRFDEYARLYLKEEALARKVVKESSNRDLPADWSPIMPICEKCGKIATTRILSQDGENYEYICDKDVGYTKGCGYKGKSSISKHMYKITWRLHWPSWHRMFKTNLEGAGVDHHTKGGSRDTVVQVYRDVFKEEVPIGFKYGFILFKGRKYSKSKGIGMGVKDLMELLPPQIIAYALLKPDLTENIDIDPSRDNLLKLIEEYENIGVLEGKDLETLERADQKKVQAYSLCPGKRNWKTSFLDILLNFQIYGNWEKVKEKLKDNGGVDYLSKYVENWIKREYVPEQYQFTYSGKKSDDSDVIAVLSGLNENMSADDIQAFIFSYSREKGIKPGDLFKKMYAALIGKERGPRLGKLIHALGIERVKKEIG
ncbi:lysine--tRNA ligase [Candidatus Micrarchaeota archaeon]|nr:lysine--tRNA ligase [Candidatus Micrarchaeota archaeon]